MATPAARLCGFLLLLAMMFAVAYAAGARLGPVTLTHPQNAPGGTMQMSGTGQMSGSGQMSGTGQVPPRFKTTGTGR